MLSTIVGTADFKGRPNEEGVHSIVAETDLDGFVSQNILMRCGFIEEQRGETVWWRLK